jgi:pimeloyl-ACP methyl ester carboxylesterase
MAGGVTEANGFSSIFVTAPDGLRLHARSYGPRLAPNLPVVCLPGLARTAADFHDLANALASNAEAPRRVLALDYRGRGLSAYDRNPANYNLATELADAQAVLTALDVGPAVFVGTSRGGLLTIMLGSVRPAAIMGAVLNDIGPVIEPGGLVRIKSYDFNRPLPPLWSEFDALGRVPLMVVRGANSDLLSEETVAAMRARRAAMETIIVPDQGHAPLLSAPDEIARIAAFVASCEPKGRAESVDDSGRSER